MDEERLKTEHEIYIGDEITANTSGVIIYGGFYRDWRVAIKRIPRMPPVSEQKALREIEVYQRYDNKSSKIVECLFDSKGRDYDYHYLVFERARCSLFDLIQACKNRIIEHRNESCRSFLKTVEFQLWKTNGHPSPLLLSIIKDIIDSLKCLRDEGVLHHNLTPHNILIFDCSKKGLCAKLTDFSLCSPPSNDSLPINTGTEGWRCRERLRGCAEELKSDLFGLGLVMYFCVTGQHAYGNLDDPSECEKKYESGVYPSFNRP